MEELLTHSLFLSFFMAAVLGALVGSDQEIPRKILKGELHGVSGGIRGHALISILGAMCMWLDTMLGISYFLFTIIGFIVVSIYVAIPYMNGVVKREDISFASEYGAIITYFIGIIVMLGNLKFAIIFAVLITLLISLKDFFSTLKARISRDELTNTLKFAVIAFVILPLLPDERFSFATMLTTLGFDGLSGWQNPVWQMKFFNPYGIWFFVVAMSAIGYVGYIFTKIIGKKSGVMISSVLGGLISSTAVTAAMSEKSKRHKVNNSIYVLGTLVASCIMFLRVIFIVLLFNAALLVPISIPSLVMFVLLAGSAVYFFVKSKNERNISQEVSVEEKVESPFQIAPALKFAGFIVIIKFIAGIGIVFKDIWGDGIFYYALGVISGLADVDAITQTMAVEASEQNVIAKVAVYTILISVMSNNLVKGTMAWKFGDKGYGRKVLISFLITMVGGLAAMMFVR